MHYITACEFNYNFCCNFGWYENDKIIIKIKLQLIVLQYRNGVTTCKW